MPQTTTGRARGARRPRTSATWELTIAVTGESVAGDLLDDLRRGSQPDLGADLPRQLETLAARTVSRVDDRAVVALTVPAPDAWTSVLEAMVVLQRVGYDVQELQLTRA